MIKTPVVVKTEEDFDGRPIALLVQEASQYASTIYIQVGEKHINAKSRKVLKINWFSELFLFFTMQNKVVFGKKKRTYSWDFF